MGFTTYSDGTLALNATISRPFVWISPTGREMAFSAYKSGGPDSGAMWLDSEGYHYPSTQYMYSGCNPAFSTGDVATATVTLSCGVQPTSPLDLGNVIGQVDGHTLTFLNGWAASVTITSTFVTPEFPLLAVTRAELQLDGEVGVYTPTRELGLFACLEPASGKYLVYEKYGLVQYFHIPLTCLFASGGSIPVQVTNALRRRMSVVGDAASKTMTAASSVLGDVADGANSAAATLGDVASGSDSGTVATTDYIVTISFLGVGFVVAVVGIAVLWSRNKKLRTTTRQLARDVIDLTESGKSDLGASRQGAPRPAERLEDKPLSQATAVDVAGGRSLARRN
jgi:hypothetical protein